MGNPAGREWLQTRWRSPPEPRVGCERRIGVSENDARATRRGKDRECERREREKEDCACKRTHALTGTHVSRPRDIPPPPPCSSSSSLLLFFFLFYCPSSSSSRLFVHESSVYLVPFSETGSVRVSAFFLVYFCASFFRSARTSLETVRGAGSARGNRESPTLPKRLWRTSVVLIKHLALQQRDIVDSVWRPPVVPQGCDAAAPGCSFLADCRRVERSTE